MSEGCQLCSYCQTNNGKYVYGLGNLKPQLVIVGEAPGISDGRSGQPFSGRDQNKLGDADLLDKLLGEIGLTRKEVFTTNLIQCRPPLDAQGMMVKVGEENVAACHPNFDHELSFVQPKVILALGAGVAKRLVGAKTLASVQGRVIDSSEALGLTYALSGEKKTSTKKGVKVDTLFNKPDVFKVIPTFALSMVRRDPTSIETLRRAFQKAKDILSGKKAEELVYDYKYAYTEEKAFELLTEILARCDKEQRLFFDIETTGLNWYPVLRHDHVSTMLSCAFGFKEREVYGVMFREKQRSPRVMDLFKKIMQHTIPKTGHNGKFDNIFIRGEFGYQVVGYDFDTMLAAHQLKQGSKIGLGELSPVHRPDLGYYWEAIEKKLDDVYGYMKAEDDELLVYNCRDVDATATLYRIFEPQLKERGFWDCFTKITMPLANEFENLEYFGVRLDVEATKSLGRKKLIDLDGALKKIFELSGKHPEDWTDKDLAAHGITREQYKPFNPGSTQQIGRLLYGELGQPCLKLTESLGHSTDEEALAPYAEKFPWVKAILDYRGIKKELSTYIGWERKEDGTEGIVSKKDSAALLAVVDRNGRIHTSYNVAGAATGRTSSSGPNLQNIPKVPEFRRLFIPNEGWDFVDADYAGLELRIAACVSQDPVLIEVFKSGVDPHSATGAKIFGLTLEDFKGFEVRRNGVEVFPSLEKAKEKYPDLDAKEATDRKDRKERKAAKIINFGILYGKGAKSLGEEIGVSKQEAQAYLEGWYRTYAGVHKWIKDTQARVRQTGEVTYSMGRSRPLPGIWSDDKMLSSDAERQAINTPIQGTGSDCVSIATVITNRRLDRELGLDKARVVMTVHDQLVIECKKELTDRVQIIVRESMETPMPMVPNVVPLEVDMNVKKNLADKAIKKV